MKATCSSNILKYSRKDHELSSFGFEELEVSSHGFFNNGGYPEELFGEFEEKIKRKLKELEEKEAIIEKEAYEKGFAQGEKDGREIGRQSIQMVAKQLSDLIDNISTVPQQIAERYRDVLKRLIIQIAEKVIQREVQQTDDVITRSLEVAFEAIDEAHKVVIRVNPKDLALLKRNLPASLLEKFNKSARVFWEPDDNVMKGGCMIETDIQLVDATMESRMREIENIVYKM